MSHLKHILRDIDVSIVGVQTDPNVCRSSSPEYVFALHPHRRRVPTFLRRLQQNQRLGQLNGQLRTMVRTTSQASFSSCSSSSLSSSSSLESDEVGGYGAHGGLVNGMLCRQERVSACSCTNPSHEHITVGSLRVNASTCFADEPCSPLMVQQSDQQPSYHQVHRTYSECRRFYKNLLRFTNCTDKLACECMLGSCPFWTMYLLLQTINFPRKRLFNAQKTSVFQERIRSLNLFIGLVIHKLRVCREEHVRLQEMNLENGVTKPCKVLDEIEQFLALNDKVVRTFIDAENRACFKLNLKGWQSDWKNLYVVETHHDIEQDQDGSDPQDAEPVEDIPYPPVPTTQRQDNYAQQQQQLQQEAYSPRPRSQRAASKSSVGVYYLGEDCSDNDCCHGSHIASDDYELFHLESSMASTILEDEELPVTPDECEIAL